MTEHFSNETQCLSHLNSKTPGKRIGFARRFRDLLLSLGLILFAANASAAVFRWDPASLPSASDGSGNWLDPNLWWNGTANVNWADANIAIFGAGNAGTYFITNNSAIVQPVEVAFTNAGTYTLTTDGVNVGDMNCTASAGNTTAFSPGIYVATNVSAVLNVPWRLQNGADVFLGANSSLTIAQSMYASSGTAWIKGSGPTVSTVYLTNGAYGTANFISGTFCTIGVTLDISGTGSLNTGTRFDISRAGVPGTSVANSIITVHDGGQINVDVAATADNNANLQISRGGAPATVNILSGGTVTTLNRNNGNFNGKVLVLPDSGAAGPGLLNVSGGTLIVGTGPSGGLGVSSSPLALLTVMQGGGNGNTASAIFNLSSGIVQAQGLQIGPSSGSAFATNPTNQVNITGGLLYLDAPNITHAVNTGTNFAFNLSGGTIAATANWSPACSVPMNLTNINGDITFQTADINGTPFDIVSSGALTGVGGLKKTGAGRLVLSGANNYAGLTVVSNGTLAVSTLNSPTNGQVTLEGGAVAPGLPVSSVVVANVGQSWTIGTLTFDSGVPTADFAYGSFPPSTTVAPIQVNGDLNFAVTPNVTVEGSAIAVGDYPLWHYTGNLLGTPPTIPYTLPIGATATIVNNTGTKTLSLHVTTSTVTPRLLWSVGNGVWDTTTANWKQFGSSTHYTDGNLVGFDDSASGPFPITVTLNTTVSPGNVQVNSTNGYTISGTGAISSSASVEKDGVGSLTLSGTNTYNGGTTVNAGTLNINYGGDGANNSAIGTGPLTNAFGAKLDNTSGHDVTLITPISEYWNDDFTYVGSGNFNTGPGQITLGSRMVNLTVSTNILEVDGLIQDSGLIYGLGKAGAGTLTLSNFNSFNGGLQLTAGQLNINADGAVGFGIFEIDGGILDNTSGSALSLTTPSAMHWLNGFTFAGTTNLTIVTPIIALSTDPVNLTVNSNVFETDGQINGGNRTVNKSGPGTWVIGGGGANSGVGFNVNAGTVALNKSAGNADNANAITVSTNASLIVLNPTGSQLGAIVPVTVNGGTFDLNGDSETFFSLTLNAGVVRNSAASTTSTLNATNGTTLASGTSIFDVTAPDGILNISYTVLGAGALTKTGAGTLNLMTNTSYTGNTVISNGTLSLTYPTLAADSTVAINTNSILNLNFVNSDTNTVAGLVLGGTNVVAGLHNASTDPAFISGTGSLWVVPSSTINPNPGTIQFGFSSGTLSLAWPTNAGWLLQAQTNSIQIGLSNNWVTVPGSDSITNLNITIDPASASFFRLIHP